MLRPSRSRKASPFTRVRHGSCGKACGSNWPVSLNAAPYATVIGVVRSYFEQRGRGAAEKFFLGNAVAAQVMGFPFPRALRALAAAVRLGRAGRGVRRGFGERPALRP